ncbi:nucleolar GTP-binding protein [Pseudohyphozyma bogoriensis]|nr:nucleolar GTP-binding protein [Pseudohyphozyma bogoriensis]
MSSSPPSPTTSLFSIPPPANPPPRPRLQPPKTSSYPLPPPDPTAAWELKRREWLAPRPEGYGGTAGVRKAKSEEFAERLRILEGMLGGTGGASAGAGGSPTIGARADSFGIAERSSSGTLAALPPHVRPSSGLLSPTPKSASPAPPSAGSAFDAEADADLEPDGGSVIRPTGSSSRASTPTLLAQKAQEEKRKREDLERAIAGILAAFKEGRRLKDGIPLPLVVKLLYRQWLLDGTIPKDYVPSKASDSDEATATINGAGGISAGRVGEDSASTGVGFRDAVARGGGSGVGTAAFWVAPGKSSSTVGVSTGEVESYVAEPEQEVEADEEGEPELEVGRSKPPLVVGKLSGSDWREERDVESGGSDSIAF